MLGREHEFFLRLLRGRIVVIGIKGVDGHRPIDFDRFRIAVGVEEQASAEPAHRGLAGLMEHRVGPEGDDPRRRVRLLVVFLPGESRGAQVQRRAAWGGEAGEQREHGRQGAGKGVRLGHRSASFLGTKGGCGPYRGRGRPSVVGGRGEISPGACSGGGAGSPRGLTVG